MFDDIVFESLSGELVVLREEAVKQLIQYRQVFSSSKEAAGVLIGERRGKHLVVYDISIPGSKDKRSRFRVIRRSTSHKQKVDKCFKESGGRLQYLGEWHTHPEETPQPSGIDISGWSTIDTSQKKMAFVIVGTTDIWCGVKGVAIEALTKKS